MLHDDATPATPLVPGPAAGLLTAGKGVVFPVFKDALDAVMLFERGDIVHPDKITYVGPCPSRQEFTSVHQSEASADHAYQSHSELGIEASFSVSGYGMHLDASFSTTTTTDTATDSKTKSKTLVQITTAALKAYKSVLNTDSQTLLEQARHQSCCIACNTSAPVAALDLAGLFTESFKRDAKRVNLTADGLDPGYFLRHYGTHIAQRWYGGQESSRTVATSSEQSSLSTLRNAVAAKAEIDAGGSCWGVNADGSLKVVTNNTSARSDANSSTDITTTTTTSKAGLIPYGDYNSHFFSDNRDAMVHVGVDITTMTSIVDLLLMLADASSSDTEEGKADKAAYTAAANYCSDFLEWAAEQSGYHAKLQFVQEAISQIRALAARVYVNNPDWTMLGQIYHTGHYTALDQPATAEPGATPGVFTVADGLDAKTICPTSENGVCTGHDMRVHGNQGWFGVLQSGNTAAPKLLRSGSLTDESAEQYCGNCTQSWYSDMDYNMWYQCQGHYGPSGKPKGGVLSRKFFRIGSVTEPWNPLAGAPVAVGQHDFASGTGPNLKPLEMTDFKPIPDYVHFDHRVHHRFKQITAWYRESIVAITRLEVQYTDFDGSISTFTAGASDPADRQTTLTFDSDEYITELWHAVNKGLRIVTNKGKSLLTGSPNFFHHTATGIFSGGDDPVYWKSTEPNLVRICGLHGYLRNNDYLMPCLRFNRITTPQQS